VYECERVFVCGWAERECVWGTCICVFLCMPIHTHTHTHTHTFATHLTTFSHKKKALAHER
jgi:hypothetical protein